MVEKTTYQESAASETLVEMGRLNGLSDGVFAFALTLLALEIRVPEDVLLADLPNSLASLAPRFLIYLISFVVIGGAWGSHQRMLGQVRRGDGLLVWFNLLSLLFVTLVPAGAALLGHFPRSVLAIACFALVVILIQLAELWLWRHASRQRLINAALDSRVVAGIGRRMSLSAAIFAISIPLAFLSAYLVYLVWIGVFVLIFTTDWLSWQQAIQTRQATVSLNGAAQGYVNVNYGGGTILINGIADDSELLSGLFGGGLEENTHRAGEKVESYLSLPGKMGFMSLRFPWTWGPSNIRDWTFGLNRQVPIRLDIEVVNSQTNLELGVLKISELNLKAMSSSVSLSLPAQPDNMTVKIEASTASVVIKVPADVSVRIHATKAISSYEIDLSRYTMIEEGHEYRSPDYETAQHRVDIQIDLAMGSVEFL
jgi:uncharacterized membrane protein